FPTLVYTEPGPTRPKTGRGGSGELFLEPIKGTKGGIDGIGQFPTGSATPIRGHDLPKEGMVEKAPAIVTHGPIVHVQIAQDLVDVLAIHVRARNGLVQVGGIGIVVLSVMDFHGPRIYMWFQCIKGIR